ncbi:LAGLIDADG endonuclease [Arthrobacter phage Snek]|uniref:LAGLIDADG endonuclease n=1 Tax=Arthrobacter phage Tweety19 TaxID=2768133 RepID=A0A7G9W227_9CAUD|nr:HNH endonuclease [Arthrobacter phage Tweety19]QNO12690.1 LAGLIDADG endonuclease [Arthrobacter phage Tweety19]
MIHGTRDDLLWLAGLLEGEGTFDAHRGKYPRIRLAMTDRDIVGRAASLMDTKIRLSLHAAPAKPTWHAEISGERAAEIMRQILPFMGSRRSGKIAEVLGTHFFRQKAVVAAGKGTAPGPKVTRPAGVAKPLTAA